MPVEASQEIAHIHCYAIRRVNPFLGVMQVIETSGGRAVSTNGIVWDIEVRAETAPEWGSLNKRRSEKAYYRYGLWSQDDGLVSRPLSPHLEKDPLTQECNIIISCIEQQLENLPFQLADTNELWLFDALDKSPLALLASRLPDAPKPSPEPKYWASHIGAEGVPSQFRFPAAEQLTAQIKTAAGFNIKKHWVQRQTDGSGVTEKQQIIPKDIFPSFLLTENWPDEKQKSCVSDYLHWIAPSLLTLQHLDQQQRSRLEQNLTKQAISIEHHWNLYPLIIDETRLKAALVQCRLQKANK